MNPNDDSNNANFDEATGMQKKFSFSALAKLVGVPLADIRNAIIVERIVTPLRVTMAGEPVSFDFGDLHVGDEVTEEGVILATINRGGDISRPNWTTIEAGQMFVADADVERVRYHFPPADSAGSSTSRVSGIGPAQDHDEWRDLARREAKQIIKEQADRNLYPNQDEIADDVARRLRTGGIVGTSGKPITGAYIKRHALKGITSAAKKRRAV